MGDSFVRVSRRVVVVAVAGVEGFGVGGRVDEGAEVHRSFIVDGFLLDGYSRVGSGRRFQPSGATMLNGDLMAGIDTIWYGIIVLDTIERQGRIIIVMMIELVEVGLGVCKKHLYFCDNQFRWPVWLDCESLSYLLDIVSLPV